MADDKAGDVQEFGKVILTLDNVLVPPEKLSTTPSLLDGLDSETEIDLRILGCELIQTSGILLKLPQVAMASGQVLFQRFYYSKSFVKHNMEVVAMACINLASKIEEAPRRIRDVINVFHNVKQVKTGRTIQPLILDQNYINLKNQVIKAERRILKELGFCVHVKHPHKIIVMYLQVLESERNPRLLQAAWNYMNDSFRTSVFCGYHPEVIACACIHLAARQLQIPLPNSPHWFLIFNVEEDDINNICLTLLKLYSRPKPNADALDKIVNDAKKIQLEAKMKSKGGLSAANTPNSTSRAGSPKNISPSPLLINNKLKSESDRSDRSRDPREYVNAARKRTHSRSPKNYSRNFHSSSRSRSHSMSPKRRHRSSPRKYKKDVKRSRSPESRTKHSRKSKRRHRSYSRSRSRSRSYSPSKASKKYYKDKVKHRSRSRDRYKAKKRSNGHRERSRSRERYRR